MIELPDNASIVATYPREFHIKHLYATHLYRVNTGLDTPELVAYWGEGDIYLYWADLLTLKNTNHISWKTNATTQYTELVEALEENNLPTIAAEDTHRFLMALESLYDYIKFDVTNGNLHTPELMRRYKFLGDGVVSGDEFVYIPRSTALLTNIPHEVFKITSAMTEESMKSFIRSVVPDDWATRTHQMQLVKRGTDQAMELIKATMY